MTTLTMPKLPSKAKTFLKAAVGISSNRAHLTWVHAIEGHLCATDGYRFHIVRTGQAEQGRIAMQKSLPTDDDTAPRMWAFLKPLMDEPRITATVNAGVLLEQAQVLIKGGPKGRNYWYETVLCLDYHVMTLIPRYRTPLGIVRLDWRGDETRTPLMDIRYLPSALRPFDPASPAQITFPQADDAPIRFQQGDYTALIGTMRG